jgi:hypothetical protein
LPYHRPDRFVLATSSLIVSVVLATAIFFLVRDRWNDPEVKATEQAEYSTTGASARNAGARLSPTDPKLAIEPAPVGPKPVQPADRPAPDRS